MKNQFITISMTTIMLLFALSIQADAGILDPTFGSDGTGIVLTALSREDLINSCTVQSDDSIVAAGSANGYFQRIGLAKYTPNGLLDTAFNSTGTEFFLIGSSASAQAVTLDDDNKILVCGYAFQSQTDVAIARLNPDGTFDTDFNGTGIVTTSIGYGAAAYSIKIQPDTNIVVGGISAPSQADFMIARYDSSGALDNSFGVNGITSTTIGYQAIVNQIALQTDGKIIAGGYTWNGTMSCCLARYNTDGSIDTSFGPNADGTIITTLGSESVINSVIIQEDGYIIAGGYTIDDADGVTKFALIRYDTNGNLDNSFGVDGIVKTTIQYESKVYSVILQPNGAILVGGYSYGDLATQFALARYNTDGTLDSSFGTDGITLTTIGGRLSLSQISSLALQSNGDIIATGYAGASFAIARYLAA